MPRHLFAGAPVVFTQSHPDDAALVVELPRPERVHARSGRRPPVEVVRALRSVWPPLRRWAATRQLRSAMASWRHLVDLAADIASRDAAMMLAASWTLPTPSTTAWFAHGQRNLPHRLTALSPNRRPSTPKTSRLMTVINPPCSETLPAVVPHGSDHVEKHVRHECCGGETPKPYVVSQRRSTSSRSTTRPGSTSMSPTGRPPTPLPPSWSTSRRSRPRRSQNLLTDP